MDKGIYMKDWSLKMVKVIGQERKRKGETRRVLSYEIVNFLPVDSRECFKLDNVNPSLPRFYFGDV